MIGLDKNLSVSILLKGRNVLEIEICHKLQKRIPHLWRCGREGSRGAWLALREQGPQRSPRVASLPTFLAKQESRALLRYPKKSSGLRFPSIFSTAATRSARFICHRQRSHRSPPAGVCLQLRYVPSFVFAECWYSSERTLPQSACSADSPLWEGAKGLWNSMGIATGSKLPSQ